jgi:hypothetical protein
MGKFFLVLIFAAFTFLQLSAQNNPVAHNGNLIVTDSEVFEFFVNAEESDWTFHTDQNSKTLYIDFESLGGNLSHLLLKNDKNEVVASDDRLYDLPANTIYELSLSKLEKGTYTVELYTYSAVVKEEILVQ